MIQVRVPAAASGEVTLDGVRPLSDELVHVHVVVGAAEVGHPAVVVVAEVAVRSRRNVTHERRPIGRPIIVS